MITMATGARSMLAGAALTAIAAMLLTACDGTGGLLVITGSSSKPDAGPPPPSVLLGPANDLVNAGTVAKSKSYKVVYTLGQSSQDQGVDKSKAHRDNGGLIGAMNGSQPASDDAP